MDFAQSKGMKLNGSTAFTAENQFPVTLMLNGKSAPTVTASFSTDENVFKQISKELKTALKGLGTASAPQQKCINVVFKVTPETIDNQYRQVVGAVMDVFRNNQVRPATKCVVCGKDNCDLMILSGSYRPVHNACLEEGIQAAKEKAEENMTHGNYFTGILGGIVGGLIACIPSILTIWFAQKIYSILYALIPLGIYYGYKLCKGKLNKIAIVFNIILSVICTFVIEFIVLYISLATYLEVALPLDLFFQVAFTPDVISGLLPDILPALIFIALGIWISWSQISKTAHSEAQALEAVKMGAIPNPAFAQVNSGSEAPGEPSAPETAE